MHRFTTLFQILYQFWTKIETKLSYMTKMKKKSKKNNIFYKNRFFLTFFAENRKKYIFGQKIEKLSFRQKSKTKLTNLTKIEKINLLTKMEII